MMVSDHPDRWRGHPKMPAKVSFWHRDDMAVAEEELRNTPGTTVLIYDQMCATELRRRRKRGLAPKLRERIFINSAVCEGCGDCSVKSNCIAVGPKETELGRKREIDQSACNVDTSCVKGFCPSFVSLDGATLKKVAPADVDALISGLPDITPPQPTAIPYNLLLTGIGGLGVTSLSAMVGMAAHLDAIEVLCVDQIGLAQRGGAVDAHIRLAAPGVNLPGGRIPLAEADVLIAADMVTAHGKACLPLMDAGRTTGFLNSALTPTAEFTLNTETRFDALSMVRKVKAATRSLTSIDAAGLSRTYLGDAVYTIMVLLGAAWQSGVVPLTRSAVEKAIELNGAEVKANLRAFALGRAYIAGRLEASQKPEAPFDLDAFVAARMADLTDYQDEAYARDYKALVEVARKAEAPFGSTAFTEAVARYGYKLKAYKDEYEVARLYLKPEFRAALAAQFDNPDKVSIFLAPPIFGEKDQHTGLPKKRKFGPWIFKAFAVLAAFKGLRGSALDLFGYTDERRMERRLIIDYAQLINRLARDLTAHNLIAAAALARLPEEIRGFGHIKQASYEKAMTRQADLLTQFEAAQPQAGARPETKKVQTTKESVHV